MAAAPVQHHCFWNKPQASAGQSNKPAAITAQPLHHCSIKCCFCQRLLGLGSPMTVLYCTVSIGPSHSPRSVPLGLLTVHVCLGLVLDSVATLQPMQP